jgi:hypothetical protein
LAELIKPQALDSGFLVNVEESGDRNCGVEYMGVILEVVVMSEAYFDDSRF